MTSIKHILMDGCARRGADLQCLMERRQSFVLGLLVSSALAVPGFYQLVLAEGSPGGKNVACGAIEGKGESVPDRTHPNNDGTTVIAKTVQPAITLATKIRTVNPGLLRP